MICELKAIGGIRQRMDLCRGSRSLRGMKAWHRSATASTCCSSTCNGQGVTVGHKGEGRLAAGAIEESGSAVRFERWYREMNGSKAVVVEGYEAGWGVQRQQQLDDGHVT